MNTNLKQMSRKALQVAVGLSPLLAAAQTMPAVETTPGLASATDAAAMIQLNRASISSIEASFLAVPMLCKDRSAAFDPVKVAHETVSERSLAVHAALDPAATPLTDSVA